MRNCKDMGTLCAPFVLLLFGATANQKLSPRAGKVAWRSHNERGTAQSCQAILLFPLSRLTPTAPPRAVAPFGAPDKRRYLACPERGGGHERQRMDGGVEKESRLAWYPQPLSQTLVCHLSVKGSLLVQRQ